MIDRCTLCGITRDDGLHPMRAVQMRVWRGPLWPRYVDALVCVDSQACTTRAAAAAFERAERSRG